MSCVERRCYEEKEGTLGGGIRKYGCYLARKKEAYKTLRKNKSERNRVRYKADRNKPKKIVAAAMKKRDRKGDGITVQNSK